MKNENPEHIRSILKRVFHQIQRTYEQREAEIRNREKEIYGGPQKDSQKIAP